MNKDYLFNEIEKFMVKVKNDYLNNEITKLKYELMYIELRNLIKNSIDRDLLLLITKFDAIKTTYLIMK